MTLLALTLAAFALQLYDWYSTRTILSKGGVELNPVAKFCMKLVGMDVYLAVKAVVVTALTFYLGSQVIWAAVAIVAIYVGVAIFNSRSVK